MVSILETNLKKKPTKWLNESNLFPLINSSDYPWPGHNFQCDWETLRKQTSIIHKHYQNNSVAADMNYKHPVADKQFYTTYKELDAMPRSKIKLTVGLNYYRHHGHAFIPPGEISEVDILPGSVSRVRCTYNRFMSGIWTLKDESPKFRQRLDGPRFDGILLTKEHNTLDCKYGAVVNFDLEGKGPDPIEIIVTGVILSPFFKYGATSDEEWGKVESKRPGPAAVFDTGDMQITCFSKDIRSTIRMNDCMEFWRSAYLISQHATIDTYPRNTRYGRPLNILELNFKTAVEFVGQNFCHFPPGWISSMVYWDNAQGDPWA